MNDTDRLNFLLKYCKILWWPPGDAYPIEHVPWLKKISIDRNTIDCMMKKMLYRSRTPKESGELHWHKIDETKD